MKTKLKELESKFNLLTKRERVILISVLLVCLASAFQLLVVDMLTASNEKLEKQLQDAKAQTESLTRDIKLLTFSLQVGPNQAERQRIIQLELDINRVNSELNDAVSKLMPAAKVPEVMREMLSLEKKVELVSIENLPVSQLVGKELAKGQVRGTSGLYKHSFEMVIRGGYLDIYQFLTKMQQTSWQFFWDEMDYQVKHYPKADVTFVVSTLSTDEAWIGL